MSVHPEILERLQALKPLTCKTRLYSWPVKYREGFEAYYDEYARISKCWTSNWRWGSPEKWQNDNDRCQRLGVGTCLHVSPHVPDGDNWEMARDKYANRWKEVSDSLDLSLVDVVYIDLEDFKYTRCTPLTDEVVRHNQAVSRYNEAVYTIAKQFVGDSIQVRRWDNNATYYSTSSNVGNESVYNQTTWSDPVDGGWGISWYNQLEVSQNLTNLRKTIAEGKRHGIQEGSVWTTIGCSTMNWLCPGLEPELNITGNIYAHPYDPRMSHAVGSLFSHWYWRRILFNEGYCNDTYPALDKVHSVLLWPGVFHEKMDVTAVHLVAFLEGMSIVKFDSRLQEIQVEAVAKT